MNKRILGAGLGLMGLAAVGQAQAIVITGESDGAALVAALLAGGGTGIDLGSVSFSFSGHSSGGAVSSGTYTNASGTYGMGGGIVFSTGDVNAYNDGPNLATGTTTSYGVAATPDQQALLSPISGQANHYDVTQLTLTFDMLPGFDTVYFNVVWGSEEYPEWQGSIYVDAFGLYVNGVNIAFVDGLPVNVDHPYMQPVAGTELDGVLGSSETTGPFVHTFSAFVGDGSVGNTLTFILADSGDSALDSTVFFSQLGGSTPPPVNVPEPTSLLLFGAGLLGLGWVGRRRKAS